MGALTPEFLMDLESRMQVITENDYARLSSNLWWSRLMKKKTTGARRELLAWLLSTAQIVDTGPKGGKVGYDEILSQMTEFETTFAGRGLKIHKSQLEDTDGDGADAAMKWSGDIGAYMAYWPQKQCVKLLKNGHLTDSKSYDAVEFFSKAHPVNPQNTGKGTFANLFSGAAASTPSTDPNDAGYPGACPIDDSVSVDVALANLSKIVAYIEGIKMPNGEDPRFLRPVGILAPPRMRQRVVQLTNAKFIAQAASSGGGSGDVEALIQSFGFSQPILAQELSGFESDTTFFLICEELSSTQLGGLVYIEREAFKIQYYTGAQLPDLARMNELEWLTQGRYAAGYGHPFCLFKCKAT